MCKKEIMVLFHDLEKVEGKRETLWRKDKYGSIVYMPSFKDGSSNFGWDINKETKEIFNLSLKK